VKKTQSLRMQQHLRREGGHADIPGTSAWIQRKRGGKPKATRRERLLISALDNEASTAARLPADTTSKLVKRNQGSVGRAIQYGVDAASVIPPTPSSRSQAERPRLRDRYRS